MKLFISFIFLFLFAQLAFAQPFILKGTVYSANDSARVPFATIMNQTRNEGIMANANGEFSLKVFPDDNIRISAVGFEYFFFAASENNTNQSIYLSLSVHAIDTVVVRAFPPRALFKQEFLSLELPEENNINLNLPDQIMALSLPYDPRDTRVRAPNELPDMGGINFPIFTKPTKQQRQESALNLQKKMETDIGKKYNNEFISKLTGLKDDEKIVALEKFCNLSKDFILSNSQYDIALAIVDCYKEFEKERN